MVENKDLPELNTAAVAHTVRRVTEAGWQEVTEAIVQEKAITVYVNGEELATIVCSPWQIKFLAVGFLCSEGILRRPEDLTGMRIDQSAGLVYAEVAGYESSYAAKLFLKRYINPCCGRSRASFYYSADALLCKTVSSEMTISASAVMALIADLEEKSQLFRQTGGVHNAALADVRELIIFHEDIGRHNTLDKILGQCFLEGIPLDDKIIVFSGRVTSEILLKTAKMQIPILISRSAPTDLSLEIARDLGITVIGFARGKAFNVYTHPERVVC